MYTFFSSFYFLFSDEIEIDTDKRVGGKGREGGARAAVQSLFYIRYEKSEDFMNAAATGSSKCTLFINSTLLAAPVTAEVRYLPSLFFF